MCGIFGYTAKDNISAKHKKFVKALARSLMIETEIRGRDACGYMAHFRKDKATAFLKKPITAENFILSGAMEFSKFPDNLIGHTRASTSGSPAYNYNNHPIMKKNWGTIHNGILSGWNSHLDYKKWRDQMVTGTDSEILALYIEEHDGDIKNMSKEMPDADYSIASMNVNDGRILLARSTRPIVIADLTDIIGAYVFASTKYIIDDAIANTFKPFPSYKATELESYALFDLDHGKISKRYDMEEGTSRYYTSTSTNTRCCTEVGSRQYLYGKAVNFTEETTRENLGEFSSYYGVDRSYLLQLDVRNFFWDMFGSESDHIGKLFAEAHYTNSNWSKMTLTEELELAERFSEDILDYCIDDKGKFNLPTSLKEYNELVYSAAE